jgi:hypothetical protein
MKIFTVLALSTLVGCGGGGNYSTPAPPSVPTPIILPSLASLTSDMAGRPNYGTVLDRLVFLGCTLFPIVNWQIDICSNSPAPTYSNSNYFNTAELGEKFWSVVANNENAWDINCNTGPPDRSKEINKETFFITNNSDHAKLRMEMSSVNNCQKIPYLAISSVVSNTLATTYGKNIHIKFDINADMTEDLLHIHFYHFFITTIDNTGKQAFAWLYLGSPATKNKSPIVFNWNWPIKESYYYPGAKIFMVSLEDYNVASNKQLIPIVKPGQYHYDLDLDDIIRIITPEMANNTTKIIGVEFAIEQQYDFQTAIPNPIFTPMYTEMDIYNINVYTKI